MILFLLEEIRDVASVCRNDATCAYIQSCNQDSSGTYYCKFIFTIYLSEDAAKRHAEVTGKIDVNATNPEYLSKPLDLYLDDNLVETLLISKDLKGQVATQNMQFLVQVQDQQKKKHTMQQKKNMHKLQTILNNRKSSLQIRNCKIRYNFSSS